VRETNFCSRRYVRNAAQSSSDQLGAVDLDAGAHGGGHGAASHILALGSGGLGLDNGAHQSVEVLGELLRAEETDRYDAPFEGSRCGTCRSCIDNCPTGAVAPDRTIDTGRCISCRTIEREQPGQTDLHGWIFGCDACQSLCPWNRRAPQHRNAAFDAVFDPLAMDAATWLGMDEAAFEALCGRTPLTRSGLTRIRENALRNAAPEEPSER